MNWTAAVVVAQTRLGDPYFRLVLRAPEIAAAVRAGQFVELATGGATLLNKPFSVAAADCAAGTIAIVYKVVGPGTQAMARFEPGQAVRLLGPCGNGFERPTKRAYLVGGGVGIPPLLLLAAQAHEQADLTVLLGARTMDDVILEKDFAPYSQHILTTTDDGSCGMKGLVTDLLTQRLARAPAPVYACGPMPMLKAVAGVCRAARVAASVCLEAYMGCGIGICTGCVVPTVRGMERVCREGPVFAGGDVLWEQI